MRNKIICGLIALAFFMLGAPIQSDAQRYYKGYRKGYRQGYREAYRSQHRYYAPRPVYRGYRYAHPPGRAYGHRKARIAPAPVRVWIPAQRMRGPRGWYWRQGYYAWR